MLNPLPDLLTFGFFAPTFLRIVTAGLFAYLAYTHYKNRIRIAEIRFPLLGKVGTGVTWLAILLEGAVAVALFFGYYTQIAAIVGALGVLKHLVWRNKYPTFFVLPRTTSLLLLIVLLSLLFTGAGAFAFDLPL